MEPLSPEREGGAIERRNFRETLRDVANLIVGESDLLRGSENQFMEAEKHLRELHLMLTVAEGMKVDPTQQALLGEMRKLLTNASCVVEAFIAERRSQSKWSCCRRTIFFFGDMIARHRFQDEVEKIRSCLTSIKSQRTSIGIRPIDSSEDIQSAALGRILSRSNREEIIDSAVLELNYRVIRSRLMARAHSGAKQSVSIVDSEGVGTILARKIYNDSEIKSQFPCHAWITVSPTSVPQTLLHDISKQVDARPQVTDQRTLAISLHDFLSSKKHLIVLDDLRMTEDWDILREAFPESGEGSGIIVTSRVRAVALYTNPKSPPLELRLSDEDGWILLKSVIQVPKQKEVVLAIVRRCMGSALLISYVAKRIRSMIATVGGETEGGYNWILKKLTIDLRPVDDSLRKAFDFLPSYLKRCLYYFGLFQVDYDIPARRLIILWVAEGLAWKEESSDESPEVVAENYLSMLIERNMIAVVKRKPDGRVKTCRMHDVLRDEWVEKAKADNFLQAQNRDRASSSSSMAPIRRLADHLVPNDDSYSHIHGDNSSNSSFFPSLYKNVRTLLSFDWREGPTPGKEIGRFLRRGIINRCFQGMRVLDLERVFRPKLPESLGKLIHLRYLGLRWTYLENLPSSIDKLFNLQILDLKHTYISTLPRSFWKMQQLRHLYLSESYRTRFVPPRGTGSLTDLQTLWGAFVDEESILDNSLYRLTKLRKLGLTCRLTPYQQKVTAKWISSLERLESLRLISIDVSVKPSDLYLRSLSRLKNLSSIYLLGRLTNLVVVDKFPRKLTELTLSLSKLEGDPMEKLKKLPNLKILRLLCNAFVGESMSWPQGGFPSLQELKLWKLEQLKELVVWNHSLQALEKLEIRACSALRTIPEGLGHLKLLRLLKLKNMPEEFARGVVKVLRGRWVKKDETVTSRSSTDQQLQTSVSIEYAKGIETIPWRVYA